MNKNNQCSYCREKNGFISGTSIKYDDWKKTAGYSFENDYIIDFLEAFILKGENDKYAGLMVNSGNGFRYIDINYCPFCGRKLGGK